MREEAPELNNVVGSNFCDVAAFENGNTIIAIAVSDNLVKGMSGTAVQNMNLMCGLDETIGLWFSGIRDCLGYLGPSKCVCFLSRPYFDIRSLRIAFCACSLFSAWSNTTDLGESTT